MTLLTLGLIGMNMGCEDRFDSRAVNTSEGKMVDVSLTIGLDDATDGASLYPHADTKAGATEALSVQLLPTVHTKANECPDKLYYLDIHQYKTDGTHIVSRTVNPTDNKTEIGASLNVTLNDNSGIESQLLIIARGANQAVPSLSGKSLTQVRQVLANASQLNNIGTNGTNINNMPYLLYLPKVKVGDDKLQNPDGTDVRLRLKRLATKLTLNWTISNKMKGDKYDLKEVRLFQIPADYRILPEPENNKWGTVYPNSVSEFVDGFRLKDEALTKANGTRTLWMPANAQGSSSAIAYPNLRSKKNVNPATTYAEFIVDNQVKKERFYYRVYLGGNITTDFNLLENTDYNWTVNINSVKYTTDDRISMLDQTPVISTNLQPTANCFMMRPGTNICFNPYKHTSGTGGWNTYLTNGSTLSADKTITNVKVLWQTKDAGTSGDLVIGYQIDANSHQNLAHLTNGNEINNARIHVKVPNSNGGNAVIAAYNSSNVIVWSWHIWVSDYVPMRINRYSEYASAQKSTLNGTVHKYDSPLFQSNGVYAANVMMDRDLGARKGGFPGTTIGDNFTTMDVVNTYGMLYQWGRKDPFFPSADGSNTETDIIYDGDGVATGVTKIKAQVTIQKAITNPMEYYYSKENWSNDSGIANFWNAEGGMAPGKKTIYDPCPDGWKVPNIFINNRTISSENIQNNSIFTNFGQTSSNTFVYNAPPNSDYSKFLYYYNGQFYGSKTLSDSQANPKGGRLFLIGNTKIENKTIHNSVWIPANAERNGLYGADLSYAGKYGHMWCADFTASYMGFYHTLVQVEAFNSSYGWPVRCIQDNK